MPAIHFCLDMQRWEKQKFPAPVWSALTHNISDLSLGLADQGIFTVFLAFGSREMPVEVFSDGIGEFRRAPSVNRQLAVCKPGFAFAWDLTPSDLIGYKTWFSACEQMEIVDRLYASGFDDIILSGVKARCCVERTAYDFCRAGFGVTVVHNATDAGIMGSRDFTTRAAKEQDYKALCEENPVQVTLVEDILAAPFRKAFFNTQTPPPPVFNPDMPRQDRLAVPILC